MQHNPRKNFGQFVLRISVDEVVVDHSRQVSLDGHLDRIGYGCDAQEVTHVLNIIRRLRHGPIAESVAHAFHFVLRLIFG